MAERLDRPLHFAKLSTGGSITQTDPRERALSAYILLHDDPLDDIPDLSDSTGDMLGLLSGGNRYRYGSLFCVDKGGRSAR